MVHVIDTLVLSTFGIGDLTSLEKSLAGALSQPVMRAAWLRFVCGDDVIY